MPYDAWRHNRIDVKPAACRQSHRSALTLIEVLVALAVLALLAALLLPVFARARASSRRSACLSQMHQTALAVMLYAQDYDTGYPTVFADPLSAGLDDNFRYWHDHFCRATPLQPGQITWVSLVSSYAARLSQQKASGAPSDLFLNLFHCPADKHPELRPVTSYEFKLWLAENRREADVYSPPEMLMVWEQWAFHTDEMLSEYDRRAQMNGVFVDGHAAWIRLEDTTSARFGSGPDLHGDFPGVGTGQSFRGADVLP
ncbi:MAG TPA: prepilin-type N-terminal cleavage/methylation domain-containing protein [Chthonomonadaceae bacterium]|nr:prepilin-type N-terminal cleavage/methylation domain-containing protein [Chthonomonadaceae bacterium]